MTDGGIVIMKLPVQYRDVRCNTLLHVLDIDHTDVTKGLA